MSQEPMTLPPYKYKNKQFGFVSEDSWSNHKFAKNSCTNYVELEERRITTLSLYGNQMWLISYVIYPYNGPSKK